MIDGAVAPAMPLRLLDGWFMARVGRYMVAGVGPVAVAGTHFVLSLVVLRMMQPVVFGTFTFLFLAAQLSWGMSSALLCAPLQVLPAIRTESEREAREASLLSMAMISSLLGVVIFFGMALAVELPSSAALCYALYGGLALLRWFGRAWCYAYGRPFRTTGSDVAYGLTVLSVLGGTLFLLKWNSEAAAYAALMAGAGLGLLPLGRNFLRRQFSLPRLHLMRRYASIWQSQSRWALLGVVTTEATANAHTYIIMLTQGPSAFAPIAASALLLRPVNVAQNALSEFERPQLAKLIGERSWSELARSVTVFRLALGAIWIATVGIAVGLFLTDPHILFPTTYDRDILLTGFLLWMGVAAVVLLLTPEGTLLQAADEFRPLAVASVWGSLASIGAVVAILLLAPPVWTVVGIGIGWGVNLVLILRATRRWKRQNGQAR